MITFLKLVSSFILFQDFSGVVKILFWFPSIFACSVSFLFDKIGSSFSASSMGNDCFYLVFRLSFNKVRWWLDEVFSVGFSVFEGR